MQVAVGSWILEVTQSAPPSRRLPGRRLPESRDGSRAEPSSQRDRPSLGGPARGRLVDLVV